MKTLPYKLVIFDFDGTLADSFPWFLDIGDQLADRYRFRRFDRSNLQDLRALDSRELMRLHDVSPWKLPFIVRHARALMGRDIGRILLFPGIDTALAHLASRGVTLAIVSSNARSNVLSVLGPGSAAHVTHLECGVSLFGKAAKLRKVLRRTRVAPGDALLVGDELRDAAAARQAGIAFGAVTWGYTRADALLLEQPQEVFRQVADLQILGDQRPR